jgi:DNA polymerase
MKLWIDIETRGPNFKYGNAKYAKTVEVIMVQWAVDNGPVHVEDLTAHECSGTLIEVAEHATEIWAHEAAFDRTMLETTDWWPKIPLKTWRCTAALARMHGLMGGLSRLCEVFKVTGEEMKKEGKHLIKLFCTPKMDGTFNDRKSHPKEWAEFLQYGGGDVYAMRAVHKACPKWNATPRLWSMWHLDQRMNARGVAVDLKLAASCVEATTAAKAQMGDRTEEITTDLITGEVAVERTTQVARLRAYMAEEGVSLPDLTADTVARRLEDESLPEHIKELLRVRQQASKSSSAKYQRAINQEVDGRLRNLLVFCGASRTGRWAGRTLQPHNLPRPKHRQQEIDTAIRMFCRGAIELYNPDDIMGLASSCLRGIIIAEAGSRLVVSDYANIEGRDMAWIAGEAWKIEAFAAFDRKEGPDLYKVAYARAHNIDPNEIDDEDIRRQIGKVMELALQYYGGVGAFCSMAETYHLDLNDLAVSAWPVIPDTVKRAATTAWHKALKRHRDYGLVERVWVVCHALVLMWRAAHPAIVTFWGELDLACKMALKVPNKEYQVGHFVRVDRQGNWLRIRLPSGRYLNYPAPRGTDYTSSFMGVDPYTKQWKRISTYSGKRAENIVQGIAADHMMDGLMAAEDEGYFCVLSVHDEVITEPPDHPEFTHERLSQILVGSSLWADGLPLAAKGFTAYRYRK